ncbi:hypothetical protein MRB53_034968 [Persea americana]|uniref:Uncharacterized protein n=1 Tax=Persea americana TaxID=3435 RepID=A0ACC2K3A9_PERAE|nr:hypothetical protein MRB53_034968 [Persea americana]
MVGKVNDAAETIANVRPISKAAPLSNLSALHLSHARGPLPLLPSRANRTTSTSSAEPLTALHLLPPSAEIIPFTGISVLVLNHVCIVGRAFKRSLMAANRGERSSDSSIGMSTNDLENFKMVDKCRLLPNCNHSFHAHCIDSWLLKTPKLPWRAGEVLRDAMVMQRGGREALTCEWDDFCAWREKRKRRQGLCAVGVGGAVRSWRKKGRQSVGVREMKS